MADGLTSVQSVQLRNFRGFKDHTVALDQLSILVGQNNAGKSTFIDALRLLSVVGRKAKNAQYQSVPDWLRPHAYGLGFRTSFETVDFDFGNTQHNYDRAEPSRLQIVYQNRVRLTLWLGRDGSENFAQLSTPKHGIISTRSDASEIDLCPIYVMPPIGHLVPHETQIAKSRIKDYMFGRLAHRHFRNQLSELVPEYRSWCDLLQETWPGIRVEALDTNVGESGRELSLIVREPGYAAEVAWVGSGLQAWMQILWFICRTDSKSLVVLDEPDIYLHADMQRKVVKLLASGRFRQTAIATHSAEIIGDVEPSSIAVIRKRERSSWKPGRRGDLQGVIDRLGSRHNLQLSKLANARQICLYEGDDQKFLSEIALKISNETYHKFSAIPFFDIGGVNNLPQAIGAAKALHSATEGNIPVNLFIDADYRTLDELDQLKTICEANHISLHVWSKKEIENYLVSPAAILRLVQRKRPQVTLSDVELLVDDEVDKLQNYTLGAIADQWQLANKRAAASTSYAESTKILDELKRLREPRSLVSGKRLIAALSGKSKELWGVSFGPMTLCREMSASDIDGEILEVVKRLAGQANATH